MRISLEPGEETEEVRKFIDLVWPPREGAQDPVAHIAWEHDYDQRILTRTDSGKIVAQVAFVFRNGEWNGAPLRIGGIAGVGTDPSYRGQGLATAGLKRAVDILSAEGFDIGALFCADEMMPFYECLGWRHFGGVVFIAQPSQARMPWRNCMTLALKRNVSDGELYVGGLPW